MSTKEKTMNWSQRCSFAIAALCCVVPSVAQTIESISFHRVKQDRIGDFLTANKEYTDIVRKLGTDRYFSMWESLSGDREFVRITYQDKYADFDRGADPKTKDQAGVLRELVARMSQCQGDTHRIIAEIQPALSLPQSMELPKMIRVSRSDVKGDKVEEYVALMKNETLPAIKKSGVKAYKVLRIRYGGSLAEFAAVTGFDSWGDLDGGSAVQKGMAPAAYERLLTRLGELTVHRETNIYRLVPNATYMPSMAK